MIRKIITLFIGVVVMATFFNFIKHTARAIDCKNVNLVFARGSGQNYSDTNSDLNFPIWSVKNNEVSFDVDKSKGFIEEEQESAKYFKTIGDRVIKDYPKLTMQFVSLHNFEGKYNQNGYRAVTSLGSYKTAFVSNNAVDARFGYSSIIADATNDEYRQSVNDGAQELALYLQDEALLCPNQLVLLGGFSQGAQVVGDALQILHNQGQDKLLSRLGHVDLFGDPRFNGFELTTNKFNPIQDRVMYPWVRGSAGISHTGALGPRKPYVPDVLTTQTTSWCDFDDVVCGGVDAISADLAAHSHVYKDSGGWIEKNGGETYVAIKKRLSLLAGLKDNSANSPFAYWPDIKKPNKLDVMFVMDATGDETLHLVPDDKYLADNFEMIADHFNPVHYSSIHAGVITYTEFNQFTGFEDIVVSHPKTIVDLTDDIFSEFGQFRSEWGKEHFGGNNFGGVDLQDSPYSAINSALDQPNWRSDSRKVIMVFSNSWGKPTEPLTNLTEKLITARAKSKNVQILPVFTGATISENYGAGANALIDSALTFWGSLAKNARGHSTEVPDLIGPTLVYDVIMSHTLMPDPVISIANVYKNPVTKKPVRTTGTSKLTVKKGKKVALSASNSSSPTSKITTYKWDFNGDGVLDEVSGSPFTEHSFDDDFDGSVVLEVVDQNGNSQTTELPVATTNDGPQATITDTELLATPTVITTRNGSDLTLQWQPTNGQLLFTDQDGALQFVADANTGSFTLHNIPNSSFTLFVQLVNGADRGDVLQIDVPAASGAPAVVSAPTVLGENSDNTTAGAPLTDVQILESANVSSLTVDAGQNNALSDAAVGAAKGASGASALSTSGNSIISTLGNFIHAKSSHAKSKLQTIGTLLLGYFSYVLEDALVFLILLFILLTALLMRDSKNRKYNADKRKHQVKRRPYTALAN